MACGKITGNVGKWQGNWIGHDGFSEWARIDMPNISLSGIGAPSVCVPESVIPSAGVAYEVRRHFSES